MVAYIQLSGAKAPCGSTVLPEERVKRSIAEALAVGARNNNGTARAFDTLVQQVHGSEAKGYLVILVDLRSVNEHLGDISLHLGEHHTCVFLALGLRLYRHRVLELLRNHDISPQREW